MEELLAAIRMQSEMLKQIGEGQLRLEMKQDTILLALDGLVSALGDFCDYTRKLIETNPVGSAPEMETRQ